MLVLSRRLRQSVVIDGKIRVTVIKTGTGAVRLGIEAPDDVSVHREEIQNQIAGSAAPSLDPSGNWRTSGWRTK
jgi:carbon storage regulator